MSRNFRIYQKKRGHRRTGSTAMASAGEMIFYGLFFLAGCIGLAVILILLIVPEWRATNEFVGTTCVVRGKELLEGAGEDGPVYRPEIAIEYHVDDTTYQEQTYDICKSSSPDRKAQRAILDQFEIGKQYECWYDPADPHRVVLVRGYSSWIWLLLIVPISFLLIGGGGFLYRAWHWGKSAEHSAATAAGPIKLRMGAPETNGRAKFPAIPTPTDMTNSPGTTLRYRLPISSTATFGLLVVLAATVIWNSVVAVFLWNVLAGLVAGEGRWIEALVLAPFLLGGLFLIYFFFRQLLITTGVGPTLLEISDYPLCPGEDYELFLSQAGRLRLRSLQVALVGVEEVRYRQGTDTRIERRCVHRQTLFERDKFEIHRGVPFEVRCDLTLPPGIMHSFKSENNALSWSLEVQGKVAGWPDYKRTFPVIVFPESVREAEA